MAEFPTSRRRVLAGTAALVGGLAAGRAKADGTSQDVSPWMREQGAPAGDHPYGVPSPYERNVIRRMRAPARFPTAAATGTPLQDLHGIITPNGLHYERHHAGAPQIDPEAHRLLVHGLVDRPLIFTMDDIVRFPSVSRLHFLECSGNTPEFRDVPLAMSLATAPARSEQRRYGLGRAPTAAEIDAWNIDVRADGQGLPPGKGSVAQGRVVFTARCAACHGEKGQDGLADRLVGGYGTLTKANPVRTVGSYWPYATTLFDFVRRAMPFNAPESLNADEIYAVSAYILWLNGIVSENTVLDATSLPKIVMPNRNGFISPDPRPDLP